MEQVLIQQLGEFVAQFPFAAAVFLVMGVFRAIFKPVMTVLHKYVEATPNPNDDVVLAKFEGGKLYRALAYVADLLLSVKLPGQK